MELSYAFVADSAQYVDGKLYALGGDFDTIVAPKFPATHPALALVLKLRVQPLECARRHQLRVALIDADGKPIQNEIKLEFEPQVDSQHPSRAVGVGLVTNYLVLKFPTAGSYAFHVLVDDIELGTLPFYTEVSSTEMFRETEQSDNAQ